MLRDIVERSPKAAAARINLAADLLQKDRAYEALRLLEGAIPTDPHTQQHWLLQKVLALIKLSRLPEARRMLDSIGAVLPGLEPLLQWREVLLSLEAKDDTQARRQATAMKTMLKTTTAMPPEHRIMGHLRTALSETFIQLGGASESPVAVRRVAALDNEALDLAAEKYLTNLHMIDATSDRIVDKMPGNFRHLGLAALMLPGARVIACDRDPRDIGLSIFTIRFYGLHAYAHDLSDLGWYIGQQRRLMAHWHAVLPNPILTLRLRDWIDDFSGTLRKLLEFLGVPYDKACEDFHEVRRRVRTVSRIQVQERVNARGLGRWREYENHLTPLITALRDCNALDEASSN